MTLREIVNKLIAQGQSVKFKERKDRGIIITQIDDTKFKGKRGNTYARSLLGQSLTERQEEQLKRITRENLRVFGKDVITETGERVRIHGKTKRLEALPKELQKELRKAQRLFRKYNPKDRDTVRTKSIRYVLRTEGYDEAMRKIKQTEKYAQGYAYVENLSALKSRLVNDLSNESDPKEKTPVKEIINDLEVLIANDGMGFKDSDLNKFYQVLYEWENHRISGETLKAAWKSLYNKLKV